MPHSADFSGDQSSVVEVPNAAFLQGQLENLLHRLQDHHTQTLETILEKHHKELSSILSEQVVLLKNLKCTDHTSSCSQLGLRSSTDLPSVINTSLRKSNGQHEALIDSELNIPIRGERISVDSKPYHVASHHPIPIVRTPTKDSQRSIQKKHSWSNNSPVSAIRYTGPSVAESLSAVAAGIQPELDSPKSAPDLELPPKKPCEKDPGVNVQKKIVEEEEPMSAASHSSNKNLNESPKLEIEEPSSPIEPMSACSISSQHNWKSSPTRSSSHSSSKRVLSMTDKHSLELQRKGSNFSKHSVSHKHRQYKINARTGLVAFVKSPLFDYIAGFFILTNSLVIGIQTDYNAKHGQSSTQVEAFFKVTDVIFCVVFLLELLLRIAVEKKRYFFNADWKWSVFDITIVLTAVVEEIMFFAKTESGMLNMTFIRILRVLRLVRVVRVIRVLRFFRELRIMVQSTMNSVKSLGWTLILVLMVVYVFGVCLTTTTTEVLTGQSACERCTPDDFDILTSYFGDLGLTIFSLFAATSGGITWDVIVHPLVKVSPGFGFLFVFYIAFSTYTIMNVVTGVFVNDAARAARQDDDHVINLEMQHHKQYQDNVLRMFQEADEDQSGYLTIEELENHLQDFRVKMFFKALDLEVSEVGQFFQLMDPDKLGYVDLDSFVEGCLRLKGRAKNMDVVALKMEQKKLSKKWEIFADFCEEQFGCVRQVLSQVVTDGTPQKVNAMSSQQVECANSGMCKCVL